MAVYHSEAVEKSIMEADIRTRKQYERLQEDPISELYSFVLGSMGRNDTAEESEAEMKLEDALMNGSAASAIMNLAADWHGAGQESGFKMGFRMATKLLTEGLKGMGC